MAESLVTTLTIVVMARTTLTTVPQPGGGVNMCRNWGWCAGADEPHWRGVDDVLGVHALCGDSMCSGGGWWLTCFLSGFRGTSGIQRAEIFP